MASNK
jgi:hypothetical protein